MTVYFDKDNYINYLKLATTTDTGTDTLRMVKKQLNVHLNFDLTELDEYESILIEEFQSGVSSDFKMTFNKNKVNRPLNNQSFPSFHDIYLLNDPDVSKIKSQHIVMLGSVNEEIVTLNQLIINSDYSFHREKIIGTEITPTEHIDILNLPFTTLVVIDRYIFKGPEVGGNLGLYEFNLDKILKKIFANKKGYSRLIFVYQVNIKVAKTNSNYDEGPNLDALIKKIKKITIKHCPAPEIHLIGVPAGYIDDEHDRYIISNYLRIKSGDSMVYFDSAGKILTKSKTVDFYSLGYKQYRETNSSILTKISAIIEETLGKYSTYSKIPTGALNNKIINFDF